MAEQVVARVNGSPIKQADLDNAVQGYSMELYRKTMDHLSADELKEVQELALEKLLARELIFQEALSRGVVADEEAVIAETQKIIANFPSEEEFFATLEKAGIAPQAYYRMIRQDLTVNLLTEKELAALPEPEADQIEEMYRRYPEQMKKPGRVRACHILVKVREGHRAEAEARIGELKARCGKEDFAELAQNHSDCPSGSRGGDLGYFKAGDMVESFSDAAFSQEVGVVGEVVESPFGLHLIKVLNREQESSLTLEEAVPQIRKLLKEEAGARHLKDWVAGLREKAQIEING